MELRARRPADHERADQFRVRPIATWVAGDPPVTLPATHAVRATGALKIEVQRRAPADYESPFTARRSVLRLVTRITDPARRVWIEEAQCGEPSPRTGSILAIRPLLDRGGSARLWLQRPGAPASVLGWFRNFDPSFARKLLAGAPEISRQTLVSVLRANSHSHAVPARRTGSPARSNLPIEASTCRPMRLASCS